MFSSLFIKKSRITTSSFASLFSKRSMYSRIFTQRKEMPLLNMIHTVINSKTQVREATISRCFQISQRNMTTTCITIGQLAYFPQVAPKLVPAIGAGVIVGLNYKDPDEGTESDFKSLILKTAGGAAVMGAITVAGIDATAGIQGASLVLDAVMGAWAAAIASISPRFTVYGLAKSRLGYVLLGAEIKYYSVTLNCWKPVLRSESQDCCGKSVGEVITDPRIKKIGILNAEEGTFIIQNIWDEYFEMRFFQLYTGQWFAHAKRLKKNSI